jgi:1-acyl-sn-glycerol-3-phosphate acyltransferase
MGDASWQFLRRAGRFDVRRNVDLRVEGLTNVPSTGPVILAARHYHHLHDGAALMATIPRPMRILVGLDWIERSATRWAMDRACAAAGWPVVLRRNPAAPRAAEGETATLLQALNESVEIVRRGEVLLVFPEGYPTIDPTWTPKTSDTEILPFQTGVVRIATRAARAGAPVPLLPVGLDYRPGRKWQLTVRFGEPFTITRRDEEAGALDRLQTAVASLSGVST